MAGKKKTKPKKESGSTVPERSIPPTSTVDPLGKFTKSKSRDIISTFQGELEQKEGEHSKEQLKTIEKIRLLRKDNERIQRKQEAEYGMTLDMLDELKVTIDKTRASNQKLYGDMEEAKALHDKLEAELKSTRQKFRDAETLCEEFQTQTRVWEETKVKLMRSDVKVRDLRDTNKRLRFMLLNHHIDHKTDARELTVKSREHGDDISLKSNQTYPKPTMRQLTTKSRYALAKKLDSIRRLNTDDLQERYGIKRANLDQISPAYLGFYLKRQRKSIVHMQPLHNPSKDIQFTNYRTGLTLPRIEPRQYDRLTLE